MAVQVGTASGHGDPKGLILPCLPSALRRNGLVLQELLAGSSERAQTHRAACVNEAAALCAQRDVNSKTEGRHKAEGGVKAEPQAGERKSCAVYSTDPARQEHC